MIVILDFGSQYTQLIARRIRELSVFSKVLPHNSSVKEIKNLNPEGIILSGGPNLIKSHTALYLPFFIKFDDDYKDIEICKK